MNDKGRAVTAKIHRLTVPPPDRLRLALRKLEAALDDQRAAIAEFQGHVHALRGSVGEMGGSLDDFRSGLGHVQMALTAAGSAARRLERTASLPSA